MHDSPGGDRQIAVEALRQIPAALESDSLIQRRQARAVHDGRFIRDLRRVLQLVPQDGDPLAAQIATVDRDLDLAPARRGREE